MAGELSDRDVQTLVDFDDADLIAVTDVSVTTGKFAGAGGKSVANTRADFREDILDGLTLGTAAASDATDFAAAADTSVQCIWTGSAWTTLSGGTVPTSAALVREYKSLNDAAATTPTYYNDNDTWEAALS